MQRLNKKSTKNPTNQESKSQNEGGNLHNKMAGFNPILVSSVAYIGALAIFTVVYFTPMPRLPFPVQGCLLSNNHANQDLKYLILVLWALHYIRRTVEVLFIHIYKRKMPLFDSIGASVYYWVLALFVAWSINGDNYKLPTVYSIIPGVVLFVLGETGNAWCHLQLRFFRTKEYLVTMVAPETGHVLPNGCLFNWLSCPHYFFEIIAWLGFFLVTWTVPSGCLLLFTIITLVIYSHKKHGAYVAEFDGENGRPIYPKNRKALIPFIF